MTVLNELKSNGASVEDFSLKESLLEELFMPYTTDEDMSETTSTSIDDGPETEVRS